MRGATTSPGLLISFIGSCLVWPYSSHALALMQPATSDNDSNPDPTTNTTMVLPVILKPSGNDLVVRAGRRRRDYNDVTLTAAQKKKLVDIHNYYRAGIKASNMKQMEWNTELEDGAKAWAADCIYAHSPNIPFQGHKGRGQNLYVGTHKKDVSFAVNMWYNEKRNYNYRVNRCHNGKVCGHYTAVVWAETNMIGCAYHYCPRMANVPWRPTTGYYLVCDYASPGNNPYMRPYKVGSVCGDCPPEFNQCVNNLCSKTSNGAQALRAYPVSLSLAAVIVYVATL